MPTSQDERRGQSPDPFDGARSAAAVIGADGTVTDWSPQAELLLGLRAPDVLGRPAADLLAAGETIGPARVAEVLRECAEYGHWEGLARFQRADGDSVPLELRILPLHRAEGDDGWLALGLAAQTHWQGMTRPMLEHFFTRTPIGIAVLGPDLRYLWVNEALVQLTATSRERLLGRRPTEIWPGADAERIQAGLQEVLATGKVVIDEPYQGSVRSAPGGVRSWTVSAFRLDDPDGEPLGICYVIMDVTDRRRAQARMALLNDAAARVGSTLDVGRTLQALADIAVPRLADAVLIDVLPSVFKGDEPPPGPLPGDTPLRRAAACSVHEGCPESTAAIDDPVAFSLNSPAAQCLADGRGRLQTDVANADWLADDPARAAKIHQYGASSAMWVALKARGVIMGVVAFIRQEATRAVFDEEDLQLAEEFVGRAALGVDNARRFTREHNAALALQRSLLPHRLIGRAAVQVASRYLPADGQAGVGGDWFDVIPLSGARVALVVGDVVGHGIDAAAAMGRLRTAVQTLADMELPPDELLAHLDDLVIRLAEEEAADAVLGASCLYAVYDPVTRVCTMARAAHPPPAVVSPDGSVVFAELPAGPPLGLGSLPFESAEIELPEGSLLALYTDGLVRNRDRDIDAGMDRLRAALAGPGRPPEEVCARVVDSLLDGRPSDDMALLLARTRGLGPDEVASWDLPVDPAIVATARKLSARQLETWSLEDLLFTTELVVSELVTNAIRHAVGPIRLRLIRQSVLTCEVSDASSTSPRLRHARTTDEGGRGLLLIAQLTRRWGTRYTPEGKIIWAEQPIPGEQPPADRGVPGEAAVTDG
ncbi:SpoIIE family protein phosphatase [Streptomyces sp. NPDC092296]|uniref:SpoIIE family protein phosphatase n=1 Tax=Streptomyces sp. NPDC092296 TaxID=3366012 RepID=UPI00381BF6BA